MNINEALDYVHGLRWMSKKLGLTKTEALLDLVGNPEKKLKFIHVGGTNGKGSTSAMLAEILRCTGLKVGLFTSPFIMRFNERIMVSTAEAYNKDSLFGFKEIPDQALADLVTFVKAAVDKMEEPPSEFEVVTVIGLLYFLEQNCDVVVLEVGMGGEFDATNVIPAPLATILVNIGLDHMQYLGNTVAEIARTKSGIIKSRSDVVFYGECPEAEAEIENRCKETGSKLTIPDFKTIKVKKADLGGQSFAYGEYDIEMPMIGAYQRKNAAVVMEAVELLKKKGLRIDREAVEQGIKNTKWIARLEKLAENPLIFVDGSHNPQGMRATIDTIKNCIEVKKPGSPKVICVFGVMADKDVDGILKIMAEAASEIICVQPLYPRAMNCEDLYEKTSLLCGNEVDTVICGGDVPAGIEKALERASDKDIVLCLGSLYMASEVRNYISGLKEHN
ncbi:MAG: bifunctional folylpolyglutamate synthase/dihydrofolate synthase [Lachnospiraceae bacterium]|nr:bifunctional folylpolyglutamate synthase/dihydrofolate synthase [Lachnospiraceae bacterium]